MESGVLADRVSEKLASKLAKSPGVHAVDGVPGLYLAVNTKSGSKDDASNPVSACWILRYSFAGKRRDMGLGSRAEAGLAVGQQPGDLHRPAYPSEVAEMAQVHTVGDKLEAACRRAGLLDKRRRLMDDWAAWCAKAQRSSKVIVIRRTL
jgi:hypothetical protein